MKTYYGDREKCYSCYRPKSSCMCGYVNPIETKTKFVILMHPKEFKKVKNGTGHLTHLSLKNSELFVGIDFTNNGAINEIISTYQSYILYPSKDAINISVKSIDFEKNIDNTKDMAIFIIDSTWACSLKMIRESKNLQNIKHISFETSRVSQFKIKEQPAEYCLSTIESTLIVLELLKKWEIESLHKDDLDKFLNPFYKMIDYQIECIENSFRNAVRYREKNIN
ncbi:tRNA-uridine aminocarboxypropyltransferase [Sulfurimonas xiamenensis]|uniref:tRNA-uridine aminocarboxypropyltransferase n=1 Tax=Sulfurimonas xiamenensis TaxID=2590021 RepID=A0AAJ4DMP8_9BACT|nr:tRNA-uridine aminocarboxypropyltransferase [Sulfurimonas xiamenensis]QFR43417.1 DTW domain-containing protein [Sulfurimonas xiamenensis]